ncbi:MAG: aminotransferase class V-fold PLP-dependent enzyme [Pseudomonadota bacterium]
MPARRPLPAPPEAARLWRLDRRTVYLNHGAFGACPIPVLRAQQRLRDELERDPLKFMRRTLEPRLDAAREALGAFVGAAPAGLAFVANATAGVNTVLRSLRFDAGDEILVTDHGYNAATNAARFAAERAGAAVVTARVPFPLAAAEQVTAAVLEAVTPRTRLALLDHVTSPTGLVFPIERLVRELAARGVDTLVDGAHAPGLLALGVERIGAAWYVGNCHKWLCAPKSVAFLHAREDKRAATRPLVISHGANSRRTDHSRFHLEFDWQGTWDPTPALVIPEAIAFLEGLAPGGFRELAEANRLLALAARDVLCTALGVGPPAPDAMLAALAAVPLPPGDAPALSDALYARHRIEVPVFPWPAAPARLLRVSAQAYNALAQYRYLAEALQRELLSGALR